MPEYRGETALEGAYRELKEETEGELSRENTILTEFAHCAYDSGLRLYYFWGIYRNARPPRVCSTDGTLRWVSTGELLNRGFIPTTQAVCKEWSRRSYQLNKPFSIIVHETGEDRGVKLVKVLQVQDGLV
jgi:8-oxo-dGTP pyrophosphatase MutT (NUDIX family)